MTLTSQSVLSEQPWPGHPGLTASLLPCSTHLMETQEDKRRWHAHSPRGVLAPGVQHLGSWSQDGQRMILNPFKILQDKKKEQDPSLWAP